MDKVHAIMEALAALERDAAIRRSDLEVRGHWREAKDLRQLVTALQHKVAEVERLYLLTNDLVKR